jgi:hypothetical protein
MDQQRAAYGSATGTPARRAEAIEAREGSQMKRERPFRLLQLRQPISHDTVRCLRKLLAEAEAGKIIGISYAAMAANRDFFYSSCGEAHRNPAWATAMAATLFHGTLKRVFGEE